MLSLSKLDEPHDAVIDGAWRVKCAATRNAMLILAGNPNCLLFASRARELSSGAEKATTMAAETSALD